MTWSRRIVMLTALLAAVAATSPHPAAAEEPRTNAFHDPFGPATSGMPACPPAAGPLYTEDEARRESHYRVERGTSCYMAGRCRRTK